MITKKDNYAEWALLMHELDDAKEHLETLMREMIDDPEYDDANFRVDLGHIYSHLNRAWNARNRPGDGVDSGATRAIEPVPEGH